MLSINDFKGALQYLLRTNEIIIAHFVAKKHYQAALPEISVLLSERCERFFQADVAQKVLNEGGSELLEA